VLASEPYDDAPSWRRVPDRSLVLVDAAGVTITPLKENRACRSSGSTAT
jgi:glutamine amidotransferase